jgi:hypothetical protein
MLDRPKTRTKPLSKMRMPVAAFTQAQPALRSALLKAIASRPAIRVTPSEGKSSGRSAFVSFLVGLTRLPQPKPSR